MSKYEVATAADHQRAIDLVTSAYQSVLDDRMIKAVRKTGLSTEWLRFVVRDPDKLREVLDEDYRVACERAGVQPLVF